MESDSLYSDEIEGNDVVLEKIRKGTYKIVKKRNAKSYIWLIFGEIERDDGLLVPRVVYCRDCSAILKFNGKQTSNLNRHKCSMLKKQSLAPSRRKKAKTNPEEESQGNLSVDEDESDDNIFETLPEVKIPRSLDIQMATEPFPFYLNNSSAAPIVPQNPQQQQQQQEQAKQQAQPQQQQQHPVEMNTKTARLDDPRVNAAYDILKATVAKNDDCAIFGDHVANKIRQYSSRTRSIVQHHINNVLFEADIGKYDNQNDPLNFNERAEGRPRSRYPSAR